MDCTSSQINIWDTYLNISQRSSKDPKEVIQSFSPFDRWIPLIYYLVIVVNCILHVNCQMEHEATRLCMWLCKSFLPQNYIPLDLCHPKIRELYFSGDSLADCTQIIWYAIKINYYLFLDDAIKTRNCSLKYFMALNHLHYP